MSDDEGHPEWNDALEIVVKKEGEQAAALYWLHNRASGWAATRGNWIQIPAICLATITGFFSATSDLVPPVAIGAASVVVGILGTINSYFKYSQRSEGHRITSLIYHETYKRIETQLSLPKRQRKNAEEFLKELRHEMAQVGEAAPVIPEHVVQEFRAKFKDGEASKPIIGNGIDPIKIWKPEAKVPATPMTPRPIVRVVEI